jgi:hypothetical protein
MPLLDGHDGDGDEPRVRGAIVLMSDRAEPAGSG